MKGVEHLIEGYRSFRSTYYAHQRRRYEELAEKGQRPKTMVIACCDSRADPSTIFDAAPGELFVARNVANLVPPCELHGDFHGTSAALEFAVNALEVQHIVVMGHGKCGGIKAFLESQHEGRPADLYISKWLSLLRGAHGRALPQLRGANPEEQQEILERTSVLNSLDNLETFPFIAERLKAGSLSLHGAHFAIGTGLLYTWDSEAGEFVTV